MVKITLGLLLLPHIVTMSITHVNFSFSAIQSNDTVTFYTRTTINTTNFPDPLLMAIDSEDQPNAQRAELCSPVTPSGSWCS